jgi:hypothetical protein
MAVRPAPEDGTACGQRGAKHFPSSSTLCSVNGHRAPALRLRRVPTSVETGMALYVVLGTLLMATLTHEGILSRPPWLVPLLWWGLSVGAGVLIGRWRLLLVAPFPWIFASVWFASATGRWEILNEAWLARLAGVIVLAVIGISTGVLSRRARPSA